MFKAKASVLDRFEQSIWILRENFMKLIIPVFFFYIWCFWVLWGLYSYFSINLLAPLFENIDTSSVAVFGELYSSVYVMMYISIVIFFTIFNLILIIPITLWTYKTIKQIIKEEKITVWSNIMYWFANIFESFKTYWYIFAYVALIPAVLFIIFWLLLNYSLIQNIWGEIQTLSIYGLIFSCVLFLFFAIYRWQKTSFAIASAVNENSYSQPNFKDALWITQWNWWRIFGNFLLVGFILSMVVSFINQPINIIFSSNSIIEFNKIESLNTMGMFMWWNTWNLSTENILQSIRINTDDYSYLLAFVRDFIHAIIASIQFVFILIFTFVFMKRLQIEHTWKLMNKMEEL